MTGLCRRGAGGREHRLPRVVDPGGQRGTSKFGGDVLADRVALVAVHATFPLFQVDWVAWQVPVHDRLAVVGHESLATTAIYVDVPLKQRSAAVTMLPRISGANFPRQQFPTGIDQLSLFD